jgi:hypothetical protein
MKPKFLIIAGSEKCGTTSLFQYLADSDLFAVSKKKETDYFRLAEKPSLNDYYQNFEENTSKKVFLEASPGYLSESEVAATAIAETLEDYHLVFCLRDPVERFKSSFLFRQSRLYIPQELSFNEYVAACLDFEETGENPRNIDNWSLRVADSGKYTKHLSVFEQAGNHSFTIVPFNTLKDNPHQVVSEILLKIGISSDFFNSYTFGKSNVTAGFKNRHIQRTALFVNKKLETLWTKNPKLKQYLLSQYKKLNGAPKEKIEMSELSSQRLHNYYANDLKELEEKYGAKLTQ